MKIFFQKNKISIIIGILGIILIIIGYSSNGKSFSTNSNSYYSSDKIPEEYLSLTYKITKSDYCSCLTFDKDNKFYEYDCDSEVTNMPYSGEDYDTYNYNKQDNLITFKGPEKDPIEAKVLSWDSDKLVLKVLGSKQDTSCAINSKDTYEYYADQFSDTGKKIKELLNKLDDGNLIIEYWGKDGYQTCNMEYEERCKVAKLITNEEIISQLEDNKKFNFTYFRDEKGKILSVLISYDRINN